MRECGSRPAKADQLSTTHCPCCAQEASLLEDDRREEEELEPNRDISLNAERCCCCSQLLCSEAWRGAGLTSSTLKTGLGLAAYDLLQILKMLATVMFAVVAAGQPPAPPCAAGSPCAVSTGSSDWNMGYKHTEAEAGISWYTHMWKMFPGGVPASWGIGMPGTWLHGTGISFKDACACNPRGWPNNPNVSTDQANHCCDKPIEPGHDKCSFLFETIEGGPQDDERWRTGANVGCFSFTAGAGLFTYADHGPANQHPCDQIAFASLSNQVHAAAAAGGAALAASAAPAGSSR